MSDPQSDPQSDPILITGVGRRAGLHLARTFLARGRAVIGTYRSERPELDELRDAGADLQRCDFYDQQDVERLAQSIAESYPALRAVIHNASDWLPDEGEIPVAEVMRLMMQVHVSAPYQLNLALAPLLEAAADTADIIHIGDYVSARGSRKHIAYAASKAAQDNLTLSFAARLAPKVKVNSIAPALLLFKEGDDEAYREKALAKSLLQREAGLDELQRAVDYLLDSRYVTGRILHLDGGRHLQ
jgi:dihydromonapterin reductase/dihydrofolate reductase